MKWFLCKVFGHKLFRITVSKCGSLEKIGCRRCGVWFAMHHPTKWFGEWDSEDAAVMAELGIGNPVPGSAKDHCGRKRQLT